MAVSMKGSINEQMRNEPIDSGKNNKNDRRQDARNQSTGRHAFWSSYSGAHYLFAREQAILGPFLYP
jgi:hypothetical protein